MATATEGVGVDRLHAWLLTLAAAVSAEREHLTELDSAIGDADHGINLDRGMRAVAERIGALPVPGTEAAELFRTVGMTLVSTVGGASGPLYGTFFLRFGAAAGAVEVLTAAGLGAALRAGYEGVVARGRAEPGDKTMVDALLPALQAYDGALAEGVSAAVAARRAATAAAHGRDATTGLLARKGRAAYLGERSVGHPDPGAASTALLLDSLAEALA